MPANSATRRSVTSPQRPRACGERSAVESVAVSRASVCTCSPRLPIGLLARTLQFPDLCLQAAQRIGQRLDHASDGAFDGGLFLRQVARHFNARGFERGARGVQERALIGSQRGVGERLKGLGQFRDASFSEVFGCFQARHTRPHPKTGNQAAGQQTGEEGKPGHHAHQDRSF